MSGRIRVQPQSQGALDWSVASTPGENTKATVSRPALGVGVRNICNGFTFLIIGSDGVDPTVSSVTIGVLDGASGSGVYLWGPLTIPCPPNKGGLNGATLQDLWLTGSPNTPMTIEFSAASGAHTTQSVTMQGTVQ